MTLLQVDCAHKKARSYPIVGCSGVDVLLELNAINSCRTCVDWSFACVARDVIAFASTLRRLDGQYQRA